MKRLFLGLAPDAQALSHCKKILNTIPAGIMRPVPAANLHITLLFLGNVNPETESALINNAHSMSFPPLSIPLNQLTYWAKPQILCLTSSHPNQALQTLAGQLRAMATALDITLDNRAYVPHVTLAKKVKRPITVEFSAFIWRSTEFSLFESLPTDQGVEYRNIHSWLSSRPGEKLTNNR